MTVSFFETVRNHKIGDFATWLAEAKEAGLPEFRALAKGLEADRDAVLAALTTTWSNGQVEGQVNRLKFVKRSMYGRAKFDLL
jgi:transposase